MHNFFVNFFHLSEILAVVFILLYVALAWLLNRMSYRVSFSNRMLIALFVGLILGLIIQAISGFEAKPLGILWVNQIHVWYAFVVSLFVSLLKLMIIPIVFFGISSALLKIEGHINIKSLLVKSILWLLLSTAFASLVGLFLGYTFHLGVNELVQTSKTIKEARGLNEILLGLMPNNIFSAFAANNIVAAILVAFLFSLSVRRLSQEQEWQQLASGYIKMIVFINQIIADIMRTIIQIMPMVIIAMIANTLITNGLAAMKEAALFIVLTYLAGIIMAIVFALVLAFNKINPLMFYKKAAPTLILAFTSRSSAGVLPFTINTLENKLGVSTSTANFTAGLGATIGMCGCAGYYVGLVAAFMLNSLQIEITLSYVVLIAIITILGSLSIAGIPGISIVAASIMISGLGLNEHFYLLGVVFAIDPIIDMVRTMSNVTGAMIAAVCTDKGLGTLNKERMKE